MKVKVVRRILEANDRIAELNRQLFSERGIYTLNLMSAPGAGKTTLLERTIVALKDRTSIGVIEGDIATKEDARRISRLGVPVVQINTDGACHLDANMIRQALEDMILEGIKVLFIENVGNLVCPAEFDVGEDDKVMIYGITEGEEKPLKYPLMFQESSVVILNKMDLLPYLDTDLPKLRENILRINPKIRILEVSCKTGEGLDAWYNWLLNRAKKN